jgi:tetratricopeptide (TPR) repeat protein
MRKPILFSINILVSTILVVLTQSFASAKTALEIERTAKAVTVKIIPDIGDSSGSGVIAQKQGDIYTIITNAHVICKEQEEWNKICSLSSKYTIVTADNQKYQVLAEAVKKVPGDLDLAVIKIRISKFYPIAQFANSAQVKNQDSIYTAGFPSQESRWKLSEAPRWKFGSGKVAANVRNRLKGDGGGYTMLYDSDTLPGMSGGGVFDSQGRVVAIHGLGDKYNEGTDINDNANYRVGQKIGINRGIPINLLKLNNIFSFNNDNKKIELSTADEYLIASYNTSMEPDLKNIKASKHTALKLINKAINLKPNYLHAYILRGWIYFQLKEYQQALVDYNMAISIDSKHAIPYMARGSVKVVMNDRKGAIKDYDRSIELNPNNTIAIESRAISYHLTGNTLKAISDLNRLSIIDSRNIYTHNLRCFMNIRSERFVDALNDCKYAIVLYDRFKKYDPEIKKYPIHLVYNNLGIIKFQMGRGKEGLTDLDRAVTIKPSEASSYINRGTIKYSMGNNAEALIDFNNALNLRANNIELYAGLGYVHDNLGHIPEAISYYSKSLDIYKDEGSIFDRGLLQSGGLINRVFLKYRIIQLSGKLTESATLSPKNWLEEKIEQGVLDLLGKPK